jgi:hypothetical protein
MEHWFVGIAQWKIEAARSTISVLVVCPTYEIKLATNQNPFRKRDLVFPDGHKPKSEVVPIMTGSFTSQPHLPAIMVPTTQNTMIFMAAESQMLLSKEAGSK